MISGNGYLCSPNMEDFCKRMVQNEIEQEQIRSEIRQGLRPAPSHTDWGVGDISDRHWNRHPAQEQGFLLVGRGRGETSEKSGNFLTYKRFPEGDKYNLQIQIFCARI